MRGRSNSDWRCGAVRGGLAAALLAAISGCSGPTPVQPPPDAAGPETPSARARAETAAAKAAGVAARPGAELERYQRAADYSAAHAGRAVLIVQAGEVVFEAGQNGDPSDAAYPLYNASESFWGLVGAAADADGWLDLDEPVRFTIEEFAADALKRDIRIRQLLHYTSGLEPGVQALQRDHTPDLYQRSITLQAISTPGERFQYGPSHVTVFAEVLSRKLGPRGGDPLRYLEERILARIGLAVSAWERDAAGNLDVAYGARLQAREWAKLGTLLSNRGRWGDDAVLPADAVDAVVARSEASPEFGLGIWRNVSEQSSAGGFYPQGLPEMVVAAGVGNQRLYVIPSLELVVVRFGRPDRRWLDREFLAPLVAIDSASPDGSVPAG